MAAKRKRVRSVERDPEGGWIARKPNGHFIFDKDWRWNSRATARAVVREYADRSTAHRAPPKSSHSSDPIPGA